MKNKKQKRKCKQYIVCGLGMTMLSIFLMGCGKEEQFVFFTEEWETDTQPVTQDSTESLQNIVSSDAKSESCEELEEEHIIVHVCGAVKTPGVYTLPAKSRVADAVEAAGGMHEDADAEYINLAGYVTDGSKIRIPTKEETKDIIRETGGISYDSGVVTSEEGSQTYVQSTLVNINTADEAQLCTLTGIGSAKAKRIIEYRTKHGPFSRIEDIMKVSGIKEAGFEKIKEQITV